MQSSSFTVESEPELALSVHDPGYRFGHVAVHSLVEAFLTEELLGLEQLARGRLAYVDSLEVFVYGAPLELLKVRGLDHGRHYLAACILKSNFEKE